MFLFFALLDLSLALPYSAREKRRGTSWLTSGQHRHVRGVRKDVAPHLRKEVNLRRTHRLLHANITHIKKKTKHGALCTFRIKTLIISVTCQLYSILYDMIVLILAYKILQIQVQNWIGMYNVSQCSAIKPLIEQRCNGKSFGLASVQNGWVSKEGRIRLVEADEEKEGRWKQEEDDKKGDTDKQKQVEGGRVKQIYKQI